MFWRLRVIRERERQRFATVVKRLGDDARCLVVRGVRVMETEAKEKLANFKVGNLPTLYYIPDFITATEETLLLNNINGAPTSKWKLLKNRRLQNWGGVVHEKGLRPQVCK